MTLKRKYFRLYINDGTLHLNIYRIGRFTYWGNIGNMRDNRFELGLTGEIKILGIYTTWQLFGEIARRDALAWGEEA